MNRALHARKLRSVAQAVVWLGGWFLLCALLGACTPYQALTAAESLLVPTSPNHHVSTVAVGRERYTVTTHTSADGRRSSVRVQ